MHYDLVELGGESFLPSSDRFCTQFGVHHRVKGPHEIRRRCLPAPLPHCCPRYWVWHCGDDERHRDQYAFVAVLKDSDRVPLETISVGLSPCMYIRETTASYCTQAV
jgi:hypothetical protein